jgi:hypothetical protein
MTEPDDIVEQLDRWIDEDRTTVLAEKLIQRARDAIVALRWAIEDREHEHAEKDQR